MRTARNRLHLVEPELPPRRGWLHVAAFAVLALVAGAGLVAVALEIAK